MRLELNLGGNTHLLEAQEIQHQLNAVLNIWIEFEQVSFNDKIEHSKYGKSEIFRSAWVADYPSPEYILYIQPIFIIYFMALYLPFAIIKYNKK